jgi:tetratricopeptide (TPR) repeat protein
VGLAAFEQAVREWAGPAKEESYARRRKVEILKAIYQARRDVGAYASLCETEGDLAPADCETLAEMCLKRRRPEDALVWVKRGLELEEKGRWPNRSAWHLPDLKRDILKKLGRSEDALASAWEDYRQAPSVYSYDDLMTFVPKADRAEWHAKALGALDGADLSSRINLLVKTKEGERLAADIEAASRGQLVALSHYTTEPAAKSLEKSHPLLAAKLHLAMAVRILEAKKSKYYDAALANLEQARKLMLKQGQDEVWAALAGEIRESHRRKSGFMPGFERIAEGRTERQPSFRDRARKRWDRGAGRGRGTS